MKEMGNFFVKLNCKNINNIKSLIIDRQGNYIKQQEKYIMCAGKYDKNGWTLVFRARSFEEAEELANLNPFIHKREEIN
jgi:dihydroorotase